MSDFRPGWKYGLWYTQVKGAPRRYDPPSGPKYGIGTMVAVIVAALVMALAMVSIVLGVVLGAAYLVLKAVGIL